MMERLREARRATMMAGAGSVANGGLSRRKQRSGSLRDSPEEDGPAGELPEMARLRDRPGKKERDRERDRDRERERDREVRDRDRERDRERERERSSRSKRRRGELRMIHGALHREDGGEESSDDSLGDEEEDDDDGSAAIRLPPPPPPPPVMLNHHHHINHHQQPHHPSSLSSSPVSMAGMGLNHQRKSFPAKIIRTPAAPTTLKVADEMIGVAVPRKARSASVKRSHESWVLGGSGGGSDPALRQSSISPARPATSPAAAGTPISPSSSNVSARKKLKSMGAKQHQHPQHHHRPPKILRATSSSPIQDDIEIEVAEVLYGLKSSKQETFSAKDSYEDKLRVSSPSLAISPQAGVLQNSGSLPNSSSGAIAPKRKRPRPVKYEEENLAAVPVAFSSPNASATSTAKPEAELPVNAEVSSPKLHAAENGGTGPQIDLQRELAKQDCNLAVADLKLPVATEVSDMKESAAAATTTSMRELSPRIKLDVNLEDSSTELKSQSVVAAAGDGLREDKFKIDLMAPPSAKSSPERDSIPDLMADQKPLLPDTEMGAKMEAMKAEEKEKAEDARLEERKAESMDKNSDSQKVLSKERTLDLQLDIDQKQDKDVVNGSNKRQIFNLKQQARGTKGELMLEKSPLPAQSASLPAMSMALGGWPGGLPPLGYIGQVPPLPAIVSMDGSAGPSAAIQPPYFLLGQPRPKRCATHFYIAQTIRYHQQLARMNPFWPAAAGSAPIYGAKPYNLNMVPPESAVLGSQLPGPIAGRSSSSQDKASGASFPSQSTKEKSSASVANLMDATQRKQQFVLQQGPQPGSANNILGPPFIFPLNQQQAAAATARSGSMKSGTPVSNGASATISSSSIPGSGSVSAAPPATVSFNYANMPANEAQYLAILQNSGYPFPIPAQVGAPPPYRGSHGQPVPFFNGSFYSPQMLHPSQLQQQQAQSQPAAAPPVGHHTSTSSGSSSSQKHQQQQRSQGNGGTASSNFPTVKPRPPMPQLPPHPSRQFDSDVGGDENPSSTDSRAAAHAQKNASVVYNHNFAMPIHSQNFALMSPAAMAAHGDKTQQHQLPGMKGGVELGPSPFAMSFASPAGLDFSAMAPNHPLFQNLPEVARHQMAVAAAACAQAAAAQQKKSTYPRTAEEGKSSASDSTKQNKTEEERKKASSTGLHAHSFSRSDASDPSVSGNLAMESASRTLNLNLTNGNRSSRLNAGAPPTSAPSSVLTSVLSGPNSQLQQQQQQLIQIQKQHQQQIQNQIAGRTKSGASNNSPTYSDRHPAVAKFPNSMSVFPQALMQGNSPSQSPPWKASMTRPSSTPVASSSTTSPSVKGLPQQPGSRAQQPAHSTSSHAQISFSVSRKPGPPSQQLPANSSPPSSVVGSPTAKGGMSGSKPGSGLGSGPASTTLASQPAKNSPSSSRKSSPGSGSRNVPSILSNSHMSSSQSSSSKSLQQQQSQQQKIQPFQQAQLFFSNPYMQNQSTPNSASSGYYQRKPGEQQSSPSPQQNPSAPSSSGMLSLSSPMSLSGGITSDPAKAVAAATAAAAANNIKGLAPGVIHPAQFAAAQSAGNAHPLMSAFPYIHSLPAVPVKPNDQKPATGNDNLRTCWQPEKR